MATADGNGWVECTCGARHWGRHGAAGLLLARRRAAVEVLLQLRAAWTHEGGTWGLVGGARDSHEDAVGAALREACEEASIEAGSVTVLSSRTGLDHGVWRYTYVLALLAGDAPVEVATPESDELRWVCLQDVERLGLHSGLRAAWPALSLELAELVAVRGG